jgi:hypothetical protein
MTVEQEDWIYHFASGCKMRDPIVSGVHAAPKQAIAFLRFAAV